MSYDVFESMGELYDYIASFSEVIRVGVYDTRLARSFSSALTNAGIRLTEKNIKSIFYSCRKKYLKIMRGEDISLNTEKDSGMVEFFLLSYLTLIDTFYMEGKYDYKKFK
ncbi:MAG: hypothetical protein ACP5NC_03745 [Nitrososphaeria archaeon]